ncbi:hypothetical protein WJX74_002796 [Apatococcus lobatus]|uniref:Tubulin epsilon and delta complex protein 1 domain-containing protein n=1 Tax=Apatococcus lobatus TaxID=904363 RepID=A0AAW1Q5F2_9CHLO
MAARTDGLRQALENSAATLACLGLPQLSAEQLRKAKFNRAETEPFWRTLHDMCILYAYRIPVGHGQPCMGMGFWRHIHDETSCSEVPAAGRELVMSTLQLAGLPWVHRLLHAEHASCSRLLLLAFAWLACKLDLFQAVMRGQPGQSQRWMLPPYPQCRTLEALSANLPKWHQVEAGSAHAMMLLGKTRAVVAQLVQAQQARLRQLDCIDHLQKDWAETAGCKPAAGFLTPYELRLLLNPQALESHRQDLEGAAAAVAGVRASQHHAETFFEWMDSVLAEHQKEQLAEAALECCSTTRHQDLHFAPGGAQMTLPKLLETCRVLDQQLQRQLPHSRDPLQHPSPVDILDNCHQLGSLSLQAPSVAPSDPSLTSWQASIMSSVAEPRGNHPADLPADIQAGLTSLHAETQQNLDKVGDAQYACGSIRRQPLKAVDSIGLSKPSETGTNTAMLRLKEEACIVARQLARVRAKNKQALHSWSSSLQPCLPPFSEI